MDSFFSVIKNGAIFATRDSSTFLNKTTTEIMQTLKIEDSALFFQTQKEIFPLSDDDKPLQKHPEMIGKRPRNIVDISTALLVKDSSFKNKFAIFVHCETQAQDKIPKFPIWLDSNSYMKMTYDEFLAQTAENLDFPNKSPSLKINGKPCTSATKITELVEAAKRDELVFCTTLEEKALYKIRMRKKILEEISTSEASYINDLNTLLNYFKPTLLKHKILNEQDAILFFKDIPTILSCHAHFFASYNARMSGYGSMVSDCLIEFSQFFKVSMNYIGNYSKISEQSRKFPEQIMEEIVRKCPLNSGGRNLQSYLITPVQRIPRYVLFIRELIKMTPKSHPDSEALDIAFQKIDTVTRDMQEQEDRNEQANFLFDLQSRLVTPVPLVAPARFLMEVYNIVFPEMSNCAGNIYLFNDILLVTAKTKNGHESALVHHGLLNISYDPNYSQTSILFFKDAILTLVEFQKPDQKEDFLSKFINLRNQVIQKLESNESQNIIFWDDCIPLKIPPQVNDPCAEAFNTDLIFIGGTVQENKERVPTPLIIYNTQTNNLSLSTTLAMPVTGASLVRKDMKLFLFGGVEKDTQKPTSDTYCFEIGGTQWTKFDTSMSIETIEPRAYHTALMFKGWMFVFGGIKTSGECTNDVWFLDVDNKMWFPQKMKSDIAPHARKCHSACIYKNLMIIHGGRCKDKKMFNDIWALNLSTFEWTELEIKNKVVLPDRSSHRSFVIGHYMFVIGGVGNDDEKLNPFVYDFNNGYVEVLQNLGNVSDLRDFGLVLTNNKIYVYGGYDDLSKRVSGKLISLTIPDRFYVPDGTPEDQDPDIQFLAKPHVVKKSVSTEKMATEKGGTSPPGKAPVIKDGYFAPSMIDLSSIHLRKVQTKTQEKRTEEPPAAPQKQTVPEKPVQKPALKPVPGAEKPALKPVPGAEKPAQKPAVAKVFPDQKPLKPVLPPKETRAATVAPAAPPPLSQSFEPNTFAKSLNIDLSSLLPFQMKAIQPRLKTLYNLMKENEEMKQKIASSQPKGVQTKIASDMKLLIIDKTKKKNGVIVIKKDSTFDTIVNDINTFCGRKATIKIRTKSNNLTPFTQASLDNAVVNTQTLKVVIN